MAAVTAKGQTPASNSPSDISTAISNISTGIEFDWNYAIFFTVSVIDSVNYSGGEKQYSTGIVCLCFKNIAGSIETSIAGSTERLRKQGLFIICTDDVGARFKSASQIWFECTQNETTNNLFQISYCVYHNSNYNTAYYLYLYSKNVFKYKLFNITNSNGIFSEYHTYLDKFNSISYTNSQQNAYLYHNNQSSPTNYTWKTCDNLSWNYNWNNYNLASNYSSWLMFVKTI